MQGSLTKCWIILLCALFWQLYCATPAIAQDSPPSPDEAVPLAPPKTSSLLLTVDYTKKTRLFTEGSIALTAPKGDDQKAWEAVKDTGYTLMEIRVKDNFSSLFPSQEKEASDPASYDFTELDGRIKMALENNCAIMLVIESSRFPGDIGKFSTELDCLLKHLSSGWGGGFRLSERELRSMVLDAAPDRAGSYWEDKEDECLRLYGLFAKAVRKVNPKIGVGGPGFDHIFKDEADYRLKDLSPRVTGWMEAMAKGKLPYDLFYMRCRSMFPYRYFLQARTVEEKILPSYDKLSALYGRPRMVLFCEVLPSGDTTALYASALANAVMCAIKGGVDVLVLPDVVKGESVVTLTLKSLNVFKECPVQLETIGLDRLCMIMMTAKSTDGRKAVFVIAGNDPVSYVLAGGESADRKEIERELRGLVENFTEKEYPPLYDRYHLNIEKLPWEKEHVTLKRFLIDDRHRGDTLEEKEFSGRKELYFNERITLPALQVIVLQATPVKDEGTEKKKP